jgi:hypothetical protein
MVHFTCDLCGKDLPATGSPRYVVKVVISPGRDNDWICDDDLADDNMEAISQVLRQIEDLGDDEVAEASRGYRFDLCPECQRRYRKDPLNRDMLRALEFSKN